MKRLATTSLATILTSLTLACLGPDADPTPEPVAASESVAPATLVELPAVDRVVLVTIDTLRADHLSSFGYPIETSPWFDDIARRGVVFRRAYSHSATTKPSHASIFTSLYPLEHGVLKNSHLLADDFLTMAEMMRASGYRTAGFVSTDVPLNGNVGQGFDHFDLPEWNDPNAKSSLYRPAKETIDRAIAWLDREVSPDERIFLWVHVYDPHSPLQPPDEHRAAIEAAASAAPEMIAGTLADQDVPDQPTEQFDKILSYDAEIRYADTELARLENRLDATGFNTDALWIVTSDHGQGLGAHGWFGHSVQIYNAQLHVPLVFRFTAGTVPPRDIDQQLVQQVDILPTLAELTGGDLSSQIVPIRGRSLTPLLRGETPARSRTMVFSQRSEYASPSRNRAAKGNYEPGSRYALQSLDYKYLLFTEGADEFYDLRADPYERNNLIDDPELEEIRERFAAEIAAIVVGAANNRVVDTVSDEDIERLRDLGYIQ